MADTKDEPYSRSSVNYRQGEFGVRYCGGCIHADHSGNAFTCLILGGMKVEPAAVCDEFQADDEVDMSQVFAEEIEGKNTDAGE